MYCLFNLFLFFPNFIKAYGYTKYNAIFPQAKAGSFPTLLDLDPFLWQLPEFCSSRHWSGTGSSAARAQADCARHPEAASGT